jgi:SprT protein
LPFENILRVERPIDHGFVEEHIGTTCLALGVPQLADEIEWSWNKRLTRAIARAHFRTNHIELSALLFPLLTVDDRKDTIIHEVCHLVAHHIHGPGIRHHGREWKSLMIEAGGRPLARSKSIEGADLFRRGPARVTFFCACREHAVTAYRAAKIERGSVFVCTRCKSALSKSPSVFTR